MTNSAWPEGALEDAIGLAKLGVEPIKVMKFLQEKFPSHKFKHNSVKSFLYRYRKRGNAAPRPYKWSQEVSGRAIALLREGLSASKTAETLDREFSQFKFHKNDVINHIYCLRRSTGDKTLMFRGPNAVDSDIKNKIMDLVKTTTLSSAQIAAQLGLTKGSVIGLVARERDKSGDSTLTTKGKRPVWKARTASIRNSGAVVKAVTSINVRQNRVEDLYRDKRELKAQRRFAMLNMNDYPNAVHILDRNECTRYSGAAMGVACIKYAQCPWPIWEDNAPFSEQFYCGNPKEEHGNYCTAHMCLAHDARLPGTFYRGNYKKDAIFGSTTKFTAENQMIRKIKEATGVKGRGDRPNKWTISPWKDRAA